MADTLSPSPVLPSFFFWTQVEDAGASEVLVLMNIWTGRMSLGIMGIFSGRFFAVNIFAQHFC